MAQICGVKFHGSDFEGQFLGLGYLMLRDKLVILKCLTRILNIFWVIFAPFVTVQ